MIWMQHKHPELATGKFTAARMVRVLIEEEMGGVTYLFNIQQTVKETLSDTIKRMHLVFGRRIKIIW
jgi:hypothetical protein